MRRCPSPTTLAEQDEVAAERAAGPRADFCARPPRWPLATDHLNGLAHASS